MEALITRGLPTHLAGEGLGLHFFDRYQSSLLVLPRSGAVEGRVVWTYLTSLPCLKASVSPVDLNPLWPLFSTDGEGQGPESQGNWVVSLLSCS